MKNTESPNEKTKVISPMMKVHRIQNSSVFYIILPYLSQLKILQLQLVNNRFYTLYVPIVLTNVTSEGETPVNMRHLKACKVMPGSKELHVLGATDNKPPLANIWEEQKLKWDRIAVIRRSTEQNRKTK